MLDPSGSSGFFTMSKGESKMGLTHQTVGANIWKQEGMINPAAGNPVIALAGNPNTGKSTGFNALTGLKQHTATGREKLCYKPEADMFFAFGIYSG